MNATYVLFQQATLKAKAARIPSRSAHVRPPQRLIVNIFINYKTDCAVHPFIKPRGARNGH